MRRLTREQVGDRRDTLDASLRSGTLDVPTAIRSMREIVQLSQAAFGRRFGLSQRQVSALETGTANPTADLLDRVGRAFGMQVGFIQRRDGRPAAAREGS